MSRARRAARWAALAALTSSLAPADGWARPDTPGSTDMFRYDPGDVVAAYLTPGGRFSIHYAQAGRHAVPAGDANADGVPDYVAGVGALYDRVLVFYEQLGFRRPPSDERVPGDHGGDGRFDVYLIDFASGSDGHFAREGCDGDVCSGYLVQENDFAGYPYSADEGNRILGSHEFFHAVQAGYSGRQSTILGEGTAVWATEQFDPSLRDFEALIPGFLERPDRSLDKPLTGASDPFSYGSALFFQFLGERLGGDVIRELWEDCVEGARGIDAPEWFAVLPALLERRGTGFADELALFARWNLLTGMRADKTRSYAAGAGYPLVKWTAFGQAPYRDESFRLFYASSQYVRVPVAGRERMTAYLATTAGDGAALRLTITTRNDRTIGPWVAVPAIGAATTVDTHAAEELVVIAVNTATSGDSLRGTLCIGSPEEVEPCVPAPAPADMAGAGTDGGAMVDGAGGCAMARRDAESARDHAGVAFLLLGGLLRRRARRRARVQ